MKILLVEDSDNKREQIIYFIKKTISNINVNFKISYQSGLEEIMENDYDFVILDMSMPIYDRNDNNVKEHIHIFAGWDILDRMNQSMIETKVAVITQYDMFQGEHGFFTLEDLDRKFKDSYDNYLGAICFSQLNWKHELKDILINMQNEIGL